MAAAVMAAAASAGMSPARASARASAASKSSIAWSTLPSEKTCDNASVADKLSINRVNMYRSYTSKNTVSASPCRWISMDHRPGSPAAGAPGGWRAALRDERQHRIARVRGLVRKVHARVQLLQQSARQDDDVDVRRLGSAVAVRNRTGPDRLEDALAVGSVSRRPKP